MRSNITHFSGLLTASLYEELSVEMQEDLNTEMLCNESAHEEFEMLQDGKALLDLVFSEKPSDNVLDRVMLYSRCRTVTLN
jgi:hypothetical protein